MEDKQLTSHLTLVSRCVCVCVLFSLFQTLSVSLFAWIWIYDDFVRAGKHIHTHTYQFILLLFRSADSLHLLNTQVARWILPFGHFLSSISSIYIHINQWNVAVNFDNSIREQQCECIYNLYSLSIRVCSMKRIFGF